MTDTASDRRLTTRVLAVWKGIAANGFPRRSQIDPRDFGADWSNCLMIDLDPVASRSRFSHVGNALRDPTWPTFDRQSVAECLEGTLLELIARHIPQVTAKRKPIDFDGSAIHDDGDILYRTVLLPLSETGKVIDGVLAAIVYREVSVAEALPLHAASQPTRTMAMRRGARANGVYRKGASRAESKGRQA
jgi:hypothetical protein